MESYTPDSNNQAQNDSATEPLTNVNVNARPGIRDGESTFETGTSNHADMTETTLAMESLYVHDGPDTVREDDEDNVVIGEDEMEEVDEIEDDNLDDDLADADEEPADDDVLTSPNRRSAGTFD
jgi:hypothetical protein